MEMNGFFFFFGSFFLKFEYKLEKFDILLKTEIKRKNKGRKRGFRDMGWRDAIGWKRLGPALCGERPAI